MPDVSTITARLRAGAWVAGRLNPKAAAVTLDVAESAVEEAYRAGGDDRAAEIVGVLRGIADAEYDDPAGGDFHLPGYYHSAADEIAARFPAGGTDG